MKLVVEAFVAERRRGRVPALAGRSIGRPDGGGLVPRLQRTLAALLDSIVDHRNQATVP
jgi:hypothetical protein